MPDRQYPEPTMAQIEWMQSAVPILKNGCPQDKTKAYVIQPCIDIRPAGRIYAGQAVDRDMSRVWHNDFIEELFRTMMVYPASSPGQPVREPYLNWKAVSKFRYKWLRPYLATAPGGFFSAELESSLMTLADHASDIELEAVVALEHDHCAAALSTKLGLADAMKLTLATLHRWVTKLMAWGMTDLPMADDVMLLSGNVKTEGTQLTQFDVVTSYNYGKYSQALDESRMWQIRVVDGLDHWLELLDPQIDPVAEKSRILDQRLMAKFSPDRGQ